MKIKSIFTGIGVWLAISGLFSLKIYAEESGTGHYMPGGNSSFIDALPGFPAIVPFGYYTFYQGDVSGTRQLPVAGLTTLGLHGTANALTVGAVWETPLTLLGGNYAAGIGVPFVWMNARATVGGLSREDNASGIGDIELLPFMLGWTNAMNMKYDVRLAVFAPSGDYTVGQLANVGKNFWTFEPSASFSYITKFGLEATAFAGIDFNTENNDTHYLSGDQLHLETTVAEHLPLPIGVVSAGVNVFYYQQITGDSGSGAVLGDFEGRTVGVGPVISFSQLIGKVPIVAELKWLPELETQNRMKGNYIWFKVGIVF